MKVRPDTIYLGDNGRAYCGEHLGYTAKVSGHDLSGQPLLEVTPEVAAEAGYPIYCEQCGKAALHLVTIW